MTGYMYISFFISVGICSAPPPPNGPNCGGVSVTSLQEGGIAMYACDEGCFLDPLSGANRTCMMDGEWSGDVPSCVCK